MWCEECASVCRAHPDLVAVYESPRGRLALLLRHTVVPLAEERTEWLERTRRTVAPIARGLRAAGAREHVLVLQWLPLARVADVLRTWTCRYEGDAARRATLSSLVERYVADRAFLALRAERLPIPRPRDADALALLAIIGDSREALKHWYLGMAHWWLGVEPPLRRTLMLETHRWILERVLGAGPAEKASAVLDLQPDGRLVRRLAGLIPAREFGAWRPWLRLVVADLEQALMGPIDERDEAWERWLFLIPYSVPVATRASSAAARFPVSPPSARSA